MRGDEGDGMDLASCAEGTVPGVPMQQHSAAQRRDPAEPAHPEGGEAEGEGRTLETSTIIHACLAGCVRARGIKRKNAFKKRALCSALLPFPVYCSSRRGC